jgi:hypothetical protein
MHTLESTALGTVAYIPAGHLEHIADDIMPIPDEYDPAEQFVHTPAPLALDWYWPAGQIIHEPDELAPVDVENLPVVHAVHALSPGYLKGRG